VGDLNTKDTLAKMEKYFGNIPRQTSPRHVDLAEPEMNGERREKMDDKLARLTLLRMGYKIPAATSADSPALSALASIFGGGESSRLYQKLVKDQEVCSSVGAGSAARMGPGLFQITCTVRPGKTPEQADALISEEIAKLHAAPVTDREVKRVRTNARRSAVAMRESVLNRAISLAEGASMYDDPNRINTNTDKLAAVTPADIQRVAKAYLRSDNRVVMTTFPEAAPPAPAKPPAAAKPNAQ
jgi:zinc protease